MKAHVRADYLPTGLTLTIWREVVGGVEVAVLGELGSWSWVAVEPGTYGPVSVRFPEQTSDVVVEAFERFMRSADGYVPTEARKDYLAERARVDKLTDAVIALAVERPGAAP